MKGFMKFSPGLRKQDRDRRPGTAHQGDVQARRLRRRRLQAQQGRRVRRVGQTMMMMMTIQNCVGLSLQLYGSDQAHPAGAGVYPRAAGEEELAPPRDGVGTVPGGKR